MTAITDKKLRDKIMKEKTLQMKKIIELYKQNTYEKKKEYDPGSSDINERKTHNKRRANSKNGTNRSETEEQKFRKPTMQTL